MLFDSLFHLIKDFLDIGKFFNQVVAVDRLWEHIPIVGLMVVENKRCGERWIVEIETLGECVDEIDKLAELIGKHKADQHWLTISPNVEVSFFTLLRTTDDVEDVIFDVYALPCFGLVLFVMALIIHAL
ncbi:hypothetical protein Tco_1420481 [Tanacetum coccineum]